MNARFVALAGVCSLLVGCGAGGQFVKGMAEPVAALNSAAAVAAEAERDMLRAKLLGLVSNSIEASAGGAICELAAGPRAAQQDLGVFGDALETVKKVGEKPSDTSYAGYIRQFRKNAAATEPPQSPEDRRKKEEEKRQAQFERCVNLYAADTSRETQLVNPAEARTGGGLTVLVGIVMSADGLAKAILGPFEQLQREAAVRATITHLIPQLEEARDALKNDLKGDFGARIVFGKDAHEVAVRMNRNVIGATITLRRWLVARQIDAQWKQLETCRNGSQKDCIGAPGVQMTMAAFVENVAAYRTLAAIDTDKVIVQLDAAVKAANDSLKVSDPAQWIDALISVADVFSSISDAYGKYDKSKDE